jgi:hypothetical protein
MALNGNLVPPENKTVAPLGPAGLGRDEGKVARVGRTLDVPILQHPSWIPAVLLRWATTAFFGRYGARKFDPAAARRLKSIT